MSVRLLKKVLKEQEQEQQRLQEEEEGAEEEEEEESRNSGAANPFDLLNHDNDDDDVPEDDVEQLQQNDSEITDEPFMRDADKRENVMKGGAGVVSTSNQRSKKKKKKKSKAGLPSSTNQVEKPLDESLETLSLDADSSRDQPGPTKTKSENTRLNEEYIKQHSPSILLVDSKCLNPENELRRIFGSKVVKSFEKSNQASSSRQVRGRRHQSHHTRKTILITPSEHWPRWDGSLSIEYLESRDGFHYFRYVHTSSYDQAQRAFEAAKAIHDLNGIASVMVYHPYHLDSLITMADYFKFVGEHQMSADAIAKCLYALECAWHPMFTPLQGNCQLKITHETNKPLFTTLFMHMKNMSKRGCHRSALEVCKLLLSLDADDPMGAMFCIDYFALRAGEYAWLERFSEEYKSDNSIWLFPNFSYSLAICRYYIEQQEISEEVSAGATKATSADLMKQALMLHPSVLKKLVVKVPLKDRAWTTILNHTFFRSEKTGSPSLDHLINIYVERSYTIWRLPDVQKLLQDTALQVLETLEHSSSEAKDWVCVRKEAFSSENNEYGHLLVSDFSDVVSTLPPDNLQNLLIDPRMREAEQNGDLVINPQNNIPAPREVTNRNALAVLLESMLPWVNYGDREDGGVNEGDRVNGHGPHNDD